MVRSLYSGVAGLKSQQTKMDVIGNNIANVGTYGFKSDRATFQDVYYQTTTAATQATGNVGGTNAKQLGYGNSVSSIDTNTATSAMTATGYSLDVAISGEGFLQVQSGDGNIMYTKAGMLDIDAEGNLVDVNGNFVLGVSGDSTNADPSSERINIALPYLDPDNAEVTEKVNDVSYTITASNYTTKGNVNFSFRSSASLPVGQKMVAEVSGSAITVTVNANEYFKSMDDFNAYLNQAITDARGGEQHPAGTFTITSSDESMFNSPLSPLDPDAKEPSAMGLKGSEIIGNNFGYELGSASYIKGDSSDPNVAKSNVLKNLFSVSTVNSGFQGDTRVSATKDGAAMKDGDKDIPGNLSISFDSEGVTIKVTSGGSVNGVTHLGDGDAVYVGTISYDNLNAPGEVILRRANYVPDSQAGVDAAKAVYESAETDLEAAQKAYDEALSTADSGTDKAIAAVETAQASVEAAQSVYDNAIIAAAAACTDTPKKTALETAKTAYETALNAAEADPTDAAKKTAAETAKTNYETALKAAADSAAAGDAKTNYEAAKTTLTAANAALTAAKADPKYTPIAGKHSDLQDAKKALAEAEADLSEKRIAASYVFSDDETDSMVINYAEFSSIKNAFQQIASADSTAVTGTTNTNISDLLNSIDNLKKGIASEDSKVTLNGGNILNLRSTEPSKDLGLGNKSFTLKGGTEGGEQTVANLTAISVGTDGVIVGVHDVYGVMQLGRIDLATFANPAGLTKVGSTYFDESLNSGDAIIVNAGTEGTGSIMASTLESSNVDLSNEFSDMIVTQRGFQASSRVITVSDSMLEELINLKR